MDTVVIKYKTKECLFNKEFIHETFKVKILPGKFDYFEAKSIQKLFKKEYIIPNLEIGSLICEELNNGYSIFLDDCITTGFSEFGEDGNFIYVANYSLNKFYDGDFTKITPIRNSRHTVILCKSIKKEKLNI